MALTTSPLDPYASAIQLWLNDGKNNHEIVALLKIEFDIDTSETSVRRCIERQNLVRPEKNQAQPEASGVRIEDDTAVITTDLTEDQLGDAEDMIRDRGLDPNDWILERVIINEWEGFYKTKAGDAEKVPLRQFKLFLKKKLSFLLVSPAVHVPEVIYTPRGQNSSTEREGTLVVIVGDEQEPYSDSKLKHLFVDWLAYNQPDRGIHLGDLMDFPTISRHKDNPEWAASVQECLNAGYATLRSYAEASTSTKWKLMVGNHDERIRNELLLRAERMYGIRPADIDGAKQEEALSLKRLLHLDALGIKFIDPEGEYGHAGVKLSSQLEVRHGWLTGKNAAGASLDRLGHSIIVGHTHHQRVHYKTIYDIDGDSKILQGVEIGTMCNPYRGIGYAVNPDWQQGFATATVFSDGSFNIELATYSNGVLRWRDQRYSNV